MFSRSECLSENFSKYFVNGIHKIVNGIHNCEWGRHTTVLRTGGSTDFRF